MPSSMKARGADKILFIFVVNINIHTFILFTQYLHSRKSQMAPLLIQATIALNEHYLWIYDV